MVNNLGLDATFGALADSTRRELLQRLAVQPATVSGLAAGYAMSLPGMLKHIRVLEQAGLVETRKVGRVRHCLLKGQRLAEATGWLETMRETWSSRLDALAEYLETTEEEPRR